VQNGDILFYASAPMMTQEGMVLGTLCVSSSSIFTPTQQQIESFNRIAELSAVYLEARYSIGRVDTLTGLPNRQFLLREMEQKTLEKDPKTYGLVIFDCIDMPRAYELIRYLGCMPWIICCVALSRCCVCACG
jgi:hypothetical protein